MSRKPLELPPDVARVFVRDMRAFFAEKNGIKADGIAARPEELPLGFENWRAKLTSVAGVTPITVPTNCSEYSSNGSLV